MTSYFKQARTKNQKFSDSVRLCKSIEEILDKQDPQINFTLDMLGKPKEYKDNSYNLSRSMLAKTNEPSAIAEVASTELRRRVGESQSLTNYYDSQVYYDRQAQLFKPIKDAEDKTKKAIDQTKDTLELGYKNLMGPNYSLDFIGPHNKPMSIADLYTTISENNDLLTKLPTNLTNEAMKL